MINRSIKCEKHANPSSFLKKLLVVNQVAGPLACELLEDLTAMGVHCCLLTGWVEETDSREMPFVVHHARPLTKFPAWKRLLSWAIFTLQAVVHITRNRRIPILITTNPPWPMLVMPLMKRLFGARYLLLVYDIYPDVLERMGKARLGGLVSRIWRFLSCRSLLEAEAVITLGRYMAETLRGHLRPGDECEIEVIPNWADTQWIQPIDKNVNPFALRHGLVGKFVVMYSGSFGETHDVESIVTAAEMLQDTPDVQFVLIGGGTREKEVARLVADRRLENLMMLPFQPFTELRYSLTAADCAIVCLDEGYEGVSVPSKTYYALAAGSAILAVSSEKTELGDLIRECNCGEIIPPRNPGRLVKAIRRFHDDLDLLGRCKQASLESSKKRFSRKTITSRYVDYLHRCLGWVR